ncbi:MAG TPA: FliH/SctL family protein, partial [Candidatus Ozemobacteraceae bacterium]|nr:FliH/SctL family protein [Candidatus Ozemobacteraceae bacterium]
MAKIFKSFQVKIDKEHHTKVPLKPPAGPTRPPTPEEREAREFQEVPLEALTGRGGLPLSDANAEKSPPPPQPRDEPGSPAESHATFVSAAAKASALIAAANRKWAELNSLEDRLREWESSLAEREKTIASQEGEHQNQFVAKRQHLEEESKKILELARKNSDSLLAQARTEAETIVKAARLEAEEIKKKAHKEGYAIGEEKGIAAGEKAGVEEVQLEWQSLMQETEMLINELQTSRMALLKSSEEEMVRLVLAMARRVIKAESSIKPEIVLRNIDAAINKISDVDKIVLRINMKDKSMAEAHKERLLKRLSGLTELRIIEDPSLAPGGVRIETGVSTIDAS